MKWPVHAGQWGLALLLLMPLHDAWAQVGVVELDARKAGRVLGPQVQVLRDPQGQLAFEAVATAGMTDRFRPSSADGLNYGFTRDAYWYRVALKNEDAAASTVRDWVLEISWPPLDEVDVYVVHASGRVEHTGTGDQRPPGSSGIEHRNYAVPLALAPGESVVLYLRVYIDGAHQLPMRVWTERAFFLKTARENLYFGMFYGTVLVMVVYNLMILLATRDLSYLYYVLFIFSLGLLQLNLDGFAFPYLWSISPKLINGSLAFVIALATVFVPLFIRRSLQTEVRAPRLHILLNIAIGIAIGSMILPFVLPVMEATFINAAIGAVTTVLMAVVIILRAIAGDRTARFYLLVWGALVVGVVVKVLEINGLLPTTVLSTYALHIGLALLVTLVSLALADQINSDRIERERLVRERADAQSAAKSEFLAKMSHELRTPMNAIVGFTDLALRSHSDERRIEHLGNIDSASRAMLRIVNDVLDLTRVEAGKLELDARPFDLRQLLNQVHGLVAVSAANKTVVVSVMAAPELPMVVVGDGARLQQVLMNLMGNAVKFTEQGEVELRVTQRHGGGGKVLLRFEVRDTGIGITPEQLETLFTPFTQGDQSITRKYGGSGLGLVISKQLVELMGGRIEVESVAGKGSHFSFDLPFRLGEMQELTPAAERQDVSHMV
jgi:two-component system, sensor histidine kinase LadS